MSVINHGGKSLNWMSLLYEYIKLREGEELKVYKDIYGYPTVGLGHKIVPGDRLLVGQKITKEQSMKFFHDDYKRLNIERYISDNPNWSGNQKLAIASFVWSHGDGQYATSNTRNLLKNANIDTDESKIQTYLKNNWDKKKPKNQERNRRDFTVFFSKTPWTNSFVDKLRETDKTNYIAPLLLIAMLFFF